VKEWIAGSGLQTILIEAGATWQNASIESLNDRFRDEFLNGELFGSLIEAQGFGEDDVRSYNGERSLFALDCRTPAE
jgi:putative transposase